MATATIAVARTDSRKASVTSTTSTMPSWMSTKTSAADPSMKTAVSRAIRISSPAGALFAISATASRTARATSTVLRPDCLRTSSETPRRPLSSA